MHNVQTFIFTIFIFFFAIVIVDLNFLKRCFKAKRRAPAYSLGVRHIKGFS